MPNLLTWLVGGSDSYKKEWSVDGLNFKIAMQFVYLLQSAHYLLSICIKQITYWSNPSIWMHAWCNFPQINSILASDQLPFVCWHVQQRMQGVASHPARANPHSVFFVMLCSKMQGRNELLAARFGF